MGAVLLKGKSKFLQVSNWTYLKTPQLGAPGACVFDLLCQGMEQSCGAAAQARASRNGNPGLLSQLLK